MSLYNYVDTPNANLICCICRAPFTDPATTLTCSHTFCGDCISRALSHSPTCPVDRTPLRPTDLAPANPIVRSLVDELVVECVYRAEGCAYTAQRQIMPQHLRDVCLFAEVACEETVPQGGEDEGEGGRLCGERMRRKELPAHRRKVHNRGDEAKESPHGVRDAEDEERRRKDAQDKPDAVDVTRLNNESEDHEETHPCPHASLGCSYTYTGSSSSSSSPSQHLLSCPYEALKGFFALHTAQSAAATAQSAKAAADTAKATSTIALLTEQNLVLRHRVDALEGAVQVLKREMGAARRALGPWFRAAGVSESTPARGGGVARSTSMSINAGMGMGVGVGVSSPSSGSGSGSVSTSAGGSGTGGRRDARAYQHEYRRSISDAHPGMGMLPGGLDAPGIAIDETVVDRLASYFPTLPGADIPGPHPHHASQVSPPSATFIPPLDLSSPTLEGTLGGLHASLGGLAAGVDALGRRSELALAHETLRIGEEMMGVRAQMHGLRMQVHGVLMDRSGAAFGGFGGVGGGGGGFVNNNHVNGFAGPGAAGAPPREDGQFRMSMGMGFMGPPSITKL